MEPSLISSPSTHTSAASDLTLRRCLTRTDISSAQRAKRNTRLGEMHLQRLGASNFWLAWNFFIIQAFLSGAGDDLMAS